MSRPSRDRAAREPLGIGEALRLAREARGLTLNQVAQETRIRVPFLLALEEEDFADLPAPIYARAFLRTYGGFLGLDVDELLALLDQQHRLDSEAKLEPATRIVSSDSVFTRLLVPSGFGAFVLGVAYFLYVQYAAFVASQEIKPPPLPTSVPAVAQPAPSDTTPFAVPTVTAVPPTATATQVPPTATATVTVVATATPRPSATRPPATATPTVAPATPTPAASPADPATEPTPSTPVASASPAAEASPTPAPPTPAAPSPTSVPPTATQVPSATPLPPTATPSGAPATVEARFSGDCWIVAEIDDKVVLNGVTQKAGDVLTWTGRKFVIKFGNAGAVDLLLNGKPAAKLGATGEVVNWNWNAP